MARRRLASKLVGMIERGEAVLLLPGDRRVVSRSRGRLEQQHDLLDAQHRRQPARLAHHRESAGKLRPIERHGEEAQGRDRRVDARRLHAARPLVQLEAAYIPRRRGRG
jgi:hypothetical protein